jgi:DNA-binding NarL/FixJ family response regulator
MAALPVLALGVDPGWRSRMQRLLGGRTDLHWMGAHVPAQQHPSGDEPAGLLLLDGDDPHVERQPRCPRRARPRRLYFFRQPDAEALRRCLQREGDGCLGKDASPATVLQAMRAAQAGLFVVDPRLLRDALPATPASAPAAPPAGDWSMLTERQREIVACAARGLSNKQIARRLGISPETVKTHLHHVFERHGVHGRVALLAAHREASD